MSKFIIERNISGVGKLTAQEMQAAAQKYGSQELLYHYADLHLTPSGNRVVADILRQMLAEAGLAS